MYDPAAPTSEDEIENVKEKEKEPEKKKDSDEEEIIDDDELHNMLGV